MEDEAPEDDFDILPAIKMIYEIKEEYDEQQPITDCAEEFVRGGTSAMESYTNNFSPEMKPRIKRFYSLSEKLKAVELAEKTSNSYAAREFNVDRKSIKDWRKSKDKLLFACTVHEDGNRKRQRGGGKKILSGELEKCLLIWIKNELTKPEPNISWRILKRKAVEIFQVLRSRGLVRASVFKGSNGWLEKFLKRNDLDKVGIIIKIKI